jgi:hypothetical protein
MLCRSRKSTGRVTVNLASLEQLRNRPEPAEKKFVGLYAPGGELDEILPLGQFPTNLEVRSGTGGDKYVIVHASDLKRVGYNDLAPPDGDIVWVSTSESMPSELFQILPTGWNSAGLKAMMKRLQALADEDIALIIKAGAVGLGHMREG